MPHTAKRPNIVILNPDQMRADTMSHLGCRAIDTKNLDALAADGVSFSNAFCQNPVCTPSRCSFMSGWYPHVAGHRTMSHMMQPWEPVLLKYLKQDGYHVWMNRRNDLLPGQSPDFYKDYCDTYFVPEEHYDWHGGDWRGQPDSDYYYSFFQGETAPRRDADQLWVDGAQRFIREYDEDRPFCLFLPFQFPHPPYGVSQPWFGAVQRDKLKERIKALPGYPGKSKMVKALHEELHLQNWTDEMYDELRAVYLGMCLRTDGFVGTIVDTLKEKGIYDDTAIFVFSDHGDYTGDYDMVEKQQNAFEDCLVNVPFIVKLPREMQKRTGVSNQLTELVDFYATAEEVAGIKPRHTHFGHSLVPFMENREDTLRDAVFCEGGFRKGEEQCKYSETDALPDKSLLYYPRIMLQMSDEMYNGKAIMCRTHQHKYVCRLYEPDELYDLEKDPQELHNVAQQPEYAGVLAALRQRLLAHYMDTSDAVPFQKDSRMDMAIPQRFAQWEGYVRPWGEEL